VQICKSALFFPQVIFILAACLAAVAASSHFPLRSSFPLKIKTKRFSNFDAAAFNQQPFAASGLGFRSANLIASGRGLQGFASPWVPVTGASSSSLASFAANSAFSGADPTLWNVAPGSLAVANAPAPKDDATAAPAKTDTAPTAPEFTAPASFSTGANPDAPQAAPVFGPSAPASPFSAFSSYFPAPAASNSAPGQYFSAPATPTAPGASFSSPASFFNAPGAPFNAPGANFNAPGANFNAPGANFNAPGAPFNAPGAPFIAPGAHFNIPGAPFNAFGAPFNSPAPQTSFFAAPATAPVATPAKVPVAPNAAPATPAAPTAAPAAPTAAPTAPTDPYPTGDPVVVARLPSTVTLGVVGPFAEAQLTLDAYNAATRGAYSGLGAAYANNLYGK